MYMNTFDKLLKQEVGGVNSRLLFQYSLQDIFIRGSTIFRISSCNHILSGTCIFTFFVS